MGFNRYTDSRTTDTQLLQEIDLLGEGARQQAHAAATRVFLQSRRDSKLLPNVTRTRAALSGHPRSPTATYVLPRASRTSSRVSLSESRGKVYAFDDEGRYVDVTSVVRGVLNQYGR